MCIIVAIPQGKSVTKDTIRRCWENNPHGGGFMYNSSGKVVVHKEMSSFKRYWKSFVAAKQNFKSSSFVLHFRISTHGKVNDTNCHPFLVNRSLGFAHNGIISAAPRSSEFSDTYMFNEAILKNLPKDFLQSPALVSLVKEYIGSGSKLSFLNSKGEIFLINESAGVWDDGVWYSNSGYKAAKYFDYGGKKMDAKPTTSYSYPKPYQSRIWDTETNHDCCDSGLGVDEGGLRSWKNPVCDWCGDALATSGERVNGCCTNCFQDILEADRIASLKLKNKVY